MKKIISLILASVLMLTLSIGASAANVSTDNGTDKADISGKYIAGAEVLDVYSVDVEWGAMQFTYTDEYIGDWNPDTHAFDNYVAPVWAAVEGTNTIKVTNHSNAMMEASFAAALDAGLNGAFTIDEANGRHISGTSTNKVLLHSAADTSLGNVADAPMCPVTYNITGGAIGADKADFAKIGSITVTIKAPIFA